ncbi:AAA family ATPase [[Ruminococcus] torques]|jgi:hypothetical protein
MGIPVLILGPSGSGKSASLRNFEPEEVGIFNVANKPLPFRKKLPTANNATYEMIAGSLKKKNKKTYVIDDSQYLMANEFFDRAKETGYQKFTDIGLHFRNLLQTVIQQTPEDVIVYFLHHTEEDMSGRLKAKTIGKMLDEKLTVEGLFSIVLLTVAEGTEHYFLTNSDGSSTAKSPMEMFDLKIDNDLRMVDQIIREYYDLTGGENEQTE